MVKNIKKCIQCNKEFISKNKVHKFCSKNCKNKNKAIRDRLKNQEGKETIICQWCGESVLRISASHIKHWHPEKTIHDYKIEFPNLPIKSNWYINMVIKRNQFKRSIELRNKMSNKLKGSNGPNHKSKTTKKERKERSPFSIEFYKRKGYSNEKEINEIISKLFDKVVKDRLNQTNYEYWLNKTNGNEEEAKRLYKKRQRTFSKEICIKKYGKEKGLEVWLNRQEKWIKNYKKNNYSKVSQEVFKQLYESKELEKYKNNIYFAILDKKNNCYNETGKRNFEYRLKLKDRWILPDFYINDFNKIIEFDGTYWHNRKETKEKDKLRDISIINSGLSVLHILEDDWKNNKNNVIKNCLTFLLKDIDKL